MAGKVFLADKATQDAIKNILGKATPDTADAKTVMNYIKLLENMLGVLGPTNPTVANTANAMNYLKRLENTLAVLGNANPAIASTANVMNYLKQLENKLNGEFDISKATVFSKSEIAPASGLTTYKEIYSVTGKGYVSCVFLGGPGANGTGGHYLKVTIDGVVIFTGYFTATELCGLGRRDLLSTNGDTYTLPMPSLAGGDVPRSQSSRYLRSYPYTVGSNGLILLSENLHFKTSLKVEIINNNSYVPYMILGGIY